MSLIRHRGERAPVETSILTTTNSEMFKLIPGDYYTVSVMLLNKEETACLNFVSRSFRSG